LGAKISVAAAVPSLNRPFDNDQMNANKAAIESKNVPKSTLTVKSISVILLSSVQFSSDQPTNGTTDERLGTRYGGAQATDAVFFGVAHAMEPSDDGGPIGFGCLHANHLPHCIDNDRSDPVDLAEAFDDGVGAAAALEVVDFDLHVGVGHVVAFS
jgi:hypothetical protein